MANLWKKKMIEQLYNNVDSTILVFSCFILSR